MVMNNASAARQPVHTVYGGAHLFREDSAPRLGRKALETLRQYAPDAATLAEALGLSSATAEMVYGRVVAKLEREPVEDYRIDFEDGFGVRTDAEEDAEAERTARELARGMRKQTLPPFIGIRIKSFTPVPRPRAMRTLDIFLNTLLTETNTMLPPGFVVTLPKITSPEEVAALADLFDDYEAAHGLTRGSLQMELMIETPQSVINERGEFAAGALVDNARERCRGAHFGTYDYTASLNITAEYQNMLHPACAP